jgi:GNAT superfamily N-acetyltransferase
VIRDAHADECEALSELAYASKASWGYDDDFMTACRDELTVRPADLERVRVRVAVDDAGSLEGFAGLDDDELIWLFVAPDRQRAGVGAALFVDACALARANGVTRLRVEADPFAAAFYERLGGALRGEVSSGSIPGRVLPVFEFAVS